MGNVYRIIILLRIKLSPLFINANVCAAEGKIDVCLPSQVYHVFKHLSPSRSIFVNNLITSFPCYKSFEINDVHRMMCPSFKYYLLVVIFFCRLQSYLYTMKICVS